MEERDLRIGRYQRLATADRQSVFTICAPSCRRTQTRALLEAVRPEGSSQSRYVPVWLRAPLWSARLYMRWNSHPLENGFTSISQTLIVSRACYFSRSKLNYDWDKPDPRTQISRRSFHCFQKTPMQ